MALPDVEGAKIYLKAWYRLFLTWQIIHWVLLLLLTAGSAAAASKYAFGDNEVFSLSIAIVGAIYAVFGPAQRAEVYREAWLILNRTVLLGKSPEEIVAAYILGEEIIGRKPAPHAN